MNLYEILGVEKNATAAQIKSAYRKMAKTAHPDGGGSDELFNELNLAYEVLKDADRRARYDATGKYDDGKMLRAAAEQRIHALIHNFLLRDDVVYTDMIAWVKNQIHVELESIADARKEAQAYLDKINELAKRVSGSEAEIQMIMAFVDQRRAQVAGALEKQNVEKEMREIALSMIKSASYKFDERPAKKQNDFGEIFRGADGKFGWPTPNDLRGGRAAGGAGRMSPGAKWWEE